MPEEHSIKVEITDPLHELHRAKADLIEVIDKLVHIQGRCSRAKATEASNSVSAAILDLRQVNRHITIRQSELKTEFAERHRREPNDQNAS